MSTIEKMEMREFRLSCSRPLRSAAGIIKERFGYLFALKSKDGVGIGESSPLPGWTESFKACREALRHSMESIEERGVERTLYDLRETPAARHGVSLACQDLKAKLDNLPLYQFLGQTDETVQNVEVNAVISNGTPDETARQAKEEIEKGFETLKLKVGKQNFKQELQRLEFVRSTVGDEIKLRLDANGEWDFKTMEDHAEALDDLNLEYIEQPFAEDQLEEHKKLREIVPVALDESLYSTGFDQILEADAADYFILKPMCAGGLDRCMSYGEQARDHGIKPVITTTIDTVVARTAAIHLAAALGDMPACGLATAGFLREDLCEDPAVPHGGKIPVPQKPGIGVDNAWAQLE